MTDKICKNCGHYSETKVRCFFTPPASIARAIDINKNQYSLTLDGAETFPEYSCSLWKEEKDD